MARKRISKKPICDIFGNIEGFEAPEKDIAIKV
jgi:hypothetical protein